MSPPAIYIPGKPKRSWNSFANSISKGRRSCRSHTRRRMRPAGTAPFNSATDGWSQIPPIQHSTIRRRAMRLGTKRTGMDILRQNIRYATRGLAKNTGLMKMGFSIFIFCACGLLARAQTGTVSGPSDREHPAGPQAAVTARFDMPKSRNPLKAYSADEVPEPVLANSSRLDRLIRDGKLYLSLKDAIDLALENNLDLAIARYNLPIADTDILRTQAGGFFRGVNTGVVQGTPGGGVGGFGAGAPGAGAGGTTGGAGGAGAGASGLVQSTLGIGTNVSSYDPILTGTTSLEHLIEPLGNLQLYGVPALSANTGIVDFNYSQAFPTGTSFSLEVDNNRQTSNSIFNSLNPTLNSYYRFTVQQQLLAGF